MKRDAPVGEVLYRDALRRQTKSAENLNKKVTPVKMQYMNDSSKRFLAHKLIKEFEQKSEEFFEEFEEHRFDYLQMCEFLKVLKFVRKCEDANNPYFIHERTLLYDMWVVLKGDKYNGVNERNLLVILLAILGLNFPIPPYMQSEQAVQKNSANPSSNVSQQEKSSNHHNNRSKPQGLKILSQEQSRQGSQSPDFYPKNKSQSQISKNSKNYPGNFSANESFDDSTKIETANVTQNKIRTVNNNGNSSFDKGCAAVDNILEECSDEVKHRLNFGVFDDKENISFTDEEVECINQVYEVLYMNRLHTSGRTPIKEVQVSRTPKVLDTSKKLADAYREKQLEQAAKYLIDTQQTPPRNGRLTHADLLIYQKSAQMHKLAQKAQELAQKELELCPFTPKTTTNKSIIINAYHHTVTQNQTTEKSEPSPSRISKRSSTPSCSLGSKRTDSLYALCKQQPKKQDKSHAEWYDERHAQECSFKPVISQSKTFDLRKKSVENIRDADKSIERVRKAREQRDILNMLLSRGTPSENGVSERSFNCGLDKSNLCKQGFEQFAVKRRSSKNTRYSGINTNDNSMNQSMVRNTASRRQNSTTNITRNSEVKHNDTINDSRLNDSRYTASNYYSHNGLTIYLMSYLSY